MSGADSDGVDRELGLSKHAIYSWKAKYDVLDVNEVRRLRQIQDERQSHSGEPGPASSGRWTSPALRIGRRGCPAMVSVFATYCYRLEKCDGMQIPIYSGDAMEG